MHKTTETLIIAKMSFFSLACLYYTFRDILPLYLDSVWMFTGSDIEKAGCFSILCFFISPVITKIVSKYNLQRGFSIAGAITYTIIISLFFALQSTFISKKPYKTPFILTTIITYESIMACVFSILEIAISDSLKNITTEETFKRTYSIQRAFIPMGKIIGSTSLAIISRHLKDPKRKYAVSLIYASVSCVVLCSIVYFTIKPAKKVPTCDIEKPDELKNIEKTDGSKKIDTPETELPKYRMFGNPSLIEYVVFLFVCGTLGAILANRASLLFRKYFKLADFYIIIYKNIGTISEVLCQFFLSDFIFNSSHTKRILTILIFTASRFLILAATPRSPVFVLHTMLNLEEILRGIANSILNITIYTVATKYSSEGNTAFLHVILSALISHLSFTIGSIFGHFATIKIDKENPENRTSYYIFAIIGFGMLFFFISLRFFHKILNRRKVESYN
eukprot:GHVP01014721.1.p1 GENE.GHVP01014721.1~~GHVP01014721.1.p1  ORF type:complete len:449 (+),score=48.12 GHVP01014721.1:1266-2612(+)